MFKVTAATLKEYFAFDSDREGALRSVDRLIRRNAPFLKRWFVSGANAGEPGMKMSMIGYGRFTYRVQASSRPIAWPIIGLALQKNYMSFYCAAKRKEAPFILEHRDRLGAVSISKTGVVNFQAAEDFDAAALAEMLRALEAGLKKRELAVSFGRLAGSPRFAKQ